MTIALICLANLIAEPKETGVTICELGQLRQCQADLTSAKAEFGATIGDMKRLVDQTHAAALLATDHYAECESRWSRRVACLAHEPIGSEDVE